ncbi:MAG: response regulator [Bacteroidales bacterium]|jgi:CheY-like chemotaxis protein|nr:response regulator [Bacteroidales bacterium]
MKLLLVEDNALNLKLMMFNLKKLNIDADIAFDGEEAVKKNAENNYDVILMDVMMPVMDGYEATKAIREDEKLTGNKSYIIGLTSNVYDSDRTKCLEAGMDNYMSKPFDVNTFNQILSTINVI